MSEPRAATVSLIEVRTPQQVDAIRALFLEYQASLGIDLCFQGFDQELDGLPGDYVGPSGGLLLAEVDGQAAGCCAFRPLVNSDHLDACEMKRLFVRPGFRGLGLGRQLVDAIVLAAQQAGYTTMLLDTLSDMESARALYQEVGFVETEPYYHNPLAGAHYLKLDLRSPAPGTA
ncbi:GNAT family N-acetyltransferase [Hydrogenophaga sp. MI9]|uniref:GNAT family N-acetyltransferase n=1 Tax=Hydrogenophaga sp. MI9 TaxID=3453719 RepID=UPI003EEBF928